MRTDWKDRIEHWAPEPPKAVWERLSEQLEADSKPAFVQKLFDFSAEPPAAAWPAITAQLEQTPAAAPLIRLFPGKKLVRIASVAASVMLAFFLLRQFSVQDTSSGVLQDAPAQQQAILPLPHTATQQQTSNAPPEQRRKTTSTMAPHNSRIYVAAAPMPSRTADPLPVTRPVKESPQRIYHVFSAAAPQVDDGQVERYIVVSLNEDAAVRLPKKLYDLFRCSDKPDPVDCSGQLSRIRQKTAAPDLLAAADFSGLLEIIQHMENSQ